jgi:proteic killer suppression protein
LTRYTPQVYVRRVIREVIVTERAEKDLRVVPSHIAEKFALWVAAVRLRGLEEVRKVPGYHDEPLRGPRRGQRSIRLSRAYRAIYEVRSDGSVTLVQVEEVNKHDY